VAPLISKQYAEQNEQLHKERTDYGAIGHRWAFLVKQICDERGFFSVLDYGCGKGTLKNKLDVEVYEYDPAIPEKDHAHPAELVVCTDVLEHVEPEYLHEVLHHIDMLGDAALLVIATGSSDKVLPDGRNAHLIIEGKGWWRKQLEIMGFNVTEHDSPRQNEVVFEVC